MVNDFPREGFIQDMQTWQSLDATHLGDLVLTAGRMGWVCSVRGPYSQMGPGATIYNGRVPSEAIWCPFRSDESVVALIGALLESTRAQQMQALLLLGYQLS